MQLGRSQGKGGLRQQGGLRQKGRSKCTYKSPLLLRLVDRLDSCFHPFYVHLFAARNTKKSDFIERPSIEW